MRGESGYIHAQCSVTVGGVYSGGGPSGYVGGSTFLFNAKLRENEYKQQRQDTFDGLAGNKSTGVGGRVSRAVNLTIYYKGTNYPPDFENFEVAVFQLVFGGGQVRTMVVLIESFKQTGDVEKSLEYTVSGETDDIFT